MTMSQRIRSKSAVTILRSPSTPSLTRVTLHEYNSRNSCRIDANWSSSSSNRMLRVLMWAMFQLPSDINNLAQSESTQFLCLHSHQDRSYYRNAAANQA